MEKFRTWFRPLARAGYGARGIVYFFAGFFALMAGLLGGEEAGSREVIDFLLEQPFGRIMLIALTVCLGGYVLWRLVQSVLDADDHGVSPVGLLIRAGLFASATTYFLLGFYALSRLGVFSGGDGQHVIADSLARLIGSHYVSLGLSVIFAGIAIAHIYKALRRRYCRYVDAPETAMWVVHPAAIGGLVSRGLIFAVLSLMTFYRFLSVDGGQGEDPPGLKDALGFIEGLPAGGFMLSLMGAGLLAFSAYSFLEARYRRIPLENADLIAA